VQRYCDCGDRSWVGDSGVIASRQFWDTAFTGNGRRCLFSGCRTRWASRAGGKKKRDEPNEGKSGHPMARQSCSPNKIRTTSIRSQWERYPETNTLFG
jgi:hypothetical protein